MSENSSPIQWHRLLGALLEMLLTEHGVTVQTEVEVMPQPPRVDILLLRRLTDQWTEAQRRLLPDGIRDTIASHVLLEFKATESLTINGLLKTAAYDLFYRQGQKLSDDMVQTFLISAKQPQAATLTKLGFVPTDRPGIYHNQNSLAARIVLISLNKLDNQLHNAFLKLFATRKKERQQSLDIFGKIGLDIVSRSVAWFIKGLIAQWADLQGVDIMQAEITAEYLIDLGKRLEDFAISQSPPEKRLEGLTPEQRLEGLTHEQRLAGLSHEQRLVGISKNELLKLSFRQVYPDKTDEEIDALIVAMQEIAGDA